MCGLVTIATFGGGAIPVERLEQMTSALGHRGPDDFGYAWVRPRRALPHHVEGGRALRRRALRHILRTPPAQHPRLDRDHGPDPRAAPGGAGQGPLGSEGLRSFHETFTASWPGAADLDETALVDLMCGRLGLASHKMLTGEARTRRRLHGRSMTNGPTTAGRQQPGLLGRLYRTPPVRTVVDTLLAPYGIFRQARLVRDAPRSQSFVYTCFRRSPSQLGALTGPVLDFLVGHDRQGDPLNILLFACADGAEAYTIASTIIRERPGVEFELVGSDLDARLVRAATAATYAHADVLSSPFITPEFVRDTFDLDGDMDIVKPAIRSRVRFVQADMLDDSLPTRFEPADVIFAQNVFFHLDERQVRKAFDNLARLLKPRAAVFIEGFDLDLRSELTRAYALEPLDYEVRKIHDESRNYTAFAWWKYYYAAEPYVPLRRDRLRRYCTVFLLDPARHGA